MVANDGKLETGSRVGQEDTTPQLFIDSSVDCGLNVGFNVREPVPVQIIDQIFFLKNGRSTIFAAISLSRTSISISCPACA